MLQEDFVHLLNSFRFYEELASPFCAQLGIRFFASFPIVRNRTRNYLCASESYSPHEFPGRMRNYFPKVFKISAIYFLLVLLGSLFSTRSLGSVEFAFQLLYLNFHVFRFLKNLGNCWPMSRLRLECCFCLLYAVSTPFSSLGYIGHLNIPRLFKIFLIVVI